MVRKDKYLGPVASGVASGKGGYLIFDLQQCRTGHSLQMQDGEVSHELNHVGFFGLKNKAPFMSHTASFLGICRKHDKDLQFP